MHSDDGCVRRAAARPRHDFGEIVRRHGEAVRSRLSLSPEQAAVLRAVAACRTAALGGHVDVCSSCGFERPAYNSCRNRHCPKCQALDQQRWLEQRQRRMLPVHCFHVVVTLPSQLAAVGLRNRRLVYDLLFRATSHALLTLGHDQKRLGAQLGITAVLHTWTRDLRFHPHVHAIVTGGGLSPDGGHWIATSPDYLFPVKVVGRLVRGFFLDHLVRAAESRSLVLPEEIAARGFTALLDQLYETSWVVYAKRPFAGPDQVFAYLGRYTHRVAISNSRLLDVSDETVTIATRDGKTATMTPQELVRRFLLHVLPRHFVKIRHYGLFASANVHSRLERARTLLEAHAPNAGPIAEAPPGETTEEPLERLTTKDPALCAACGCRTWHRIAVNPISRTARPPP